MDPISGAIAAGAVNAGVSLLGNIITGNRNAKEANRNRDFQESMSNTAHEREVKDLRAAGLNPILSALGSGASTPSGSTATMPDAGPSLGKGIETAMAVRQQNAELKQIGVGMENTQQDTLNKRVDNALMQQQAVSTAKDVDMKTMQNSMLKETMPSMIKKAKSEGDYSEINQIMGIINSGASSANQLLNPFKGIINLPGKGKKP